MGFLPGKDEIRGILRKELPKLRIRRLEMMETGWDNLIILVNGDMVFRFPRNSDSESSMKRELLLLSRIKDFPFRTPEYTFVSRNVPFFAAYPYISGVPLDRAGSLTDGLLDDMVHILDYLSRVVPADFDGTGVRVYNPETWLERQRNVVEGFMNSLAEIIGEGVFESVFDLMESSLAEMPESAISLVHGDLYRGNVIISESDHRIQGVIDWQDAFVGDGALDIAALGLDFGNDGTRRLVASTRRGSDENLQQRVDFYQKLEPFYLAEFLKHSGREQESRTVCGRILNGFQ